MTKARERERENYKINNLFNNNMDKVMNDGRSMIDNNNVFGNRDHSMTKALTDVVVFQEILEKLEPSYNDVSGFLSTTTSGLYDVGTELGAKLAGDAVLVQNGFAEVTGNNPDLLKLTGLYLAGDALKNADQGLVGNSGLVLSQLNGGGELIGDVYKQILDSNTLFTDSAEATEFDNKLKTAVEGYQTGNLLHQDIGTVQAAIKK